MPTETVTNYRTHTRGTITDSYNLNLPINSKIYMQIDQSSGNRGNDLDQT